MPSSTFATVSHASTAASSVSKMSFQRITIIGSMPLANRDGDGGAHEPVALVLEPVDLDQVRRRGRRRCAARAARRRRAPRTPRARRRAPAPAPSAPRRRRARAGRRPPRRSRRCRRARPASACTSAASSAVRAGAVAGEPVEDVVGDPVALLLAAAGCRARARRARGSRRAGRAGAATRAARCARTPRRARAARGPASASPATWTRPTLEPAGAAVPGRSQPAHGRFTGR